MYIVTSPDGTPIAYNRVGGIAAAEQIFASAGIAVSADEVGSGIYAAGVHS